MEERREIVTGKARETVLNLSVEDVLNDLKDGMETANKCGDITATVGFAVDIRNLNKIIDDFVCVEEETGLYSELTIGD